MAEIRFGPSYIPSQQSPEVAIEELVARGYGACEVGFVGGFWMSWEFAARLGELARAAGIVLSIHAPLAAFMGHAERGKKLNMAVGMLDHTAGLPEGAGAGVGVFPPRLLPAP